MTVSFVPSPTQNDVQKTLGAFLAGILPAGVEIRASQQNRVPEPPGANYVIITPLRRPRLATNVNLYADCSFLASAAGTVLTVTQSLLGTIGLGNILLGPAAAPGTLITAQTANSLLPAVPLLLPAGKPGGIGLYTLSIGQTLPPGKYACGTETIMQEIEAVFQLDVYGPASAENAQTISTLFRDDFATLWWFRNGYSAASSPLYADDPVQMPFIDDQAQFESRWKVEAHLYVNPAIVTSMDFADELHAPPISVQATFPL